MDVLLQSLKVVLVVAEVLVGIASFFGPSALIGGWILAPLDRAAKFRRAPVRFSIGDFLCLFLAIQIPLSAVYRFSSQGDNFILADRDNVAVSRSFWLFFVITWLVGPVIWYCGARTLSKAGVMSGSHRFVFMGLVMP